jgi:hypothetical protein
MHANPAKAQTIIDGIRQYVVPLFQRPYCWGGRHWETLWADVLELYEDEMPRNHFIGTIVTMQAKSRPEGVSKYTLIDGQQRLTTILLLLAAVRDRARLTPGTLGDKIDNLLLKNCYQQGDDVYKLLPTHQDRAAFFAVMQGQPRLAGASITQAYDFFWQQLAKSNVDLDRLHTAIVQRLVLVSIVLDTADNPYVIFESLNFKGEPLTQADLIRNFIFSNIETTKQEQVYAAHWQPMQDRLGEDNLTEYIRHYLTREGRIVKQGEVYYSLQESARDRSTEGMTVYLQHLAAASVHYAKLLDPDRESSQKIAPRLRRLTRFDVTVVYPFLLNVYLGYEAREVTEVEFAEILDVLENFLVRRYICGTPTHGLSRTFATLYAQAIRGGPLLDNVKAILRDRSYPRDAEFRERFVTFRLYGPGERQMKARLILDRLEESFAHKERVDFSRVSIEHVMPRTLTEWWRTHLGPDWALTHETWLDTVGNLTLTAYNAELSNDDFITKRDLLGRSHIELNRYFTGMAKWDDSSISRRGEQLADRALSIWPDFGSPLPGHDEPAEEESADLDLLTARAVAQLGGERERVGSGGFRYVRLTDGRLVNIKYGKKQVKAIRYYWYGVHHSLLEDMNRRGVTHLVLITGNQGFLTLPIAVARQYLDEARVSKTEAGDVRHYHLQVTSEPEFEAFHFGGGGKRFSWRQYFTPFAP